MLRQRTDDLRGKRLDARVKGLALRAGEELPAGEVVHRRWNVLAGGLDMPAMVLKAAELDHNLAVMTAYCRENGVDLAPHGKTTMAPQLFLRQLESGAWGMTAATAWQARLMRAFGVPRILLANQLVDPAAIAWVLAELEDAAAGKSPGLEFICYVDSVAGIEIAERVVAERSSSTRLPVLVEVGYDGGRTGCRTVGEAIALAERAARSPGVHLRGVSAFEGLMSAPSMDQKIDAIRHYLADVKVVVEAVGTAGWCDPDPVIVTAGGSAFFDLVVEHLGPSAFSMPVHTILRSGCYLTHDEEMYGHTSPLGQRPGIGSGLLHAALELWATVWSRPTRELAVVGFGKRDCPYDYRPPRPLRTRRPGSATWTDVRGAFEVFDLNDQHAFVRIPANSTLAVGDQVVCGISHPCGAFDKWRFIPLVDEEYNVTDGIFTFF
ncbi:alanine racemase [Marmoricola sp. URHA0025 HA25]